MRRDGDRFAVSRSDFAGVSLHTTMHLYKSNETRPSGMPQAPTFFSMGDQNVWGFWDLDAGHHPAQAYNEATFRYFLSAERGRSERSNRPFALLLVDLKKQPGERDQFDPELAERLFMALSLCLRETDFLGWYHEGRVAGAILTQLSDDTRTQVTGQLLQRFRELQDGFLAECADRLRMRMYHLPMQAPELGEDAS